MDEPSSLHGPDICLVAMAVHRQGQLATFERSLSFEAVRSGGGRRPPFSLSAYSPGKVLFPLRISSSEMEADRQGNDEERVRAFAGSPS